MGARKGLPSFFVRVGADPAGFVASTQWASGFAQSPQQVAMVIIAWLDRSGSLASPIVDGLFSALGDARNYFDAEAAAKRLVALGDLGDVASDRLAALYWENDQVHGGVLPNRVLKPFYAQHDRAYPPSKSALVPVADEPPF